MFLLIRQQEGFASDAAQSETDRTCLCSDNRMGASVSTPAAATVQAEAVMATPPEGCPMQHQAPPTKGERVSFWLSSLKVLMCCNLMDVLSLCPPAECPVKQAEPVKGQF